MTKTVLYLIEAKKYFENLVNILKRSNGRIIYITTNKPSSYLLDLFKKNKINTNAFFFIDCISKQTGGVKETSNVLFIENPKSLTTIGIAIHESLKKFKGKKTIVLDSLSVLLLYNDALTIGKFSNFLINKMRQENVETIILALKSDVEKEIIKQISVIIDATEIK